MAKLMNGNWAQHKAIRETVLARETEAPQLTRTLRCRERSKRAKGGVGAACYFLLANRAEVILSGRCFFRIERNGRHWPDVACGEVRSWGQQRRLVDVRAMSGYSSIATA